MAGNLGASHVVGQAAWGGIRGRGRGRGEDGDEDEDEDEEARGKGETTVVSEVGEDGHPLRGRDKALIL